MFHTVPHVGTSCSPLYRPMDFKVLNAMGAMLPPMPPSFYQVIW